MNSILDQLDADEEDLVDVVAGEEGTDVDQRASIPVYEMKFPELFVYWREFQAIGSIVSKKIFSTVSNWFF